MESPKFKGDMQKLGFGDYVRIDMIEKEKLYEDWPKSRFAFVTDDKRYLLNLFK